MNAFQICGVFALLLFPAAVSAHAAACSDSYEEELARNMLLSRQLGMQLNDLGSDGTGRDAGDSLLMDGIVQELRQSDACMKELADGSGHDGSAGIVRDGAWAVALVLSGAVLGAFVADWFRRRSIKNDGSETIRLALGALEGTLGKTHTFTDNATGDQFTYVNRDLSTDSFESIISSGAFIHLDPVLQRSLDELHGQIRFHNRTFMDMTRLTEKIRVDGMTNVANARRIVANHMADLGISEDTIRFDIQMVRKLL